VTERLDARQLADVIRASGTPATAVDGIGSLVASVAGDSQPGDVILVMSNGDFGGIHQKLLDALAVRTR